jgi:hypothetical protein
MRKVTSMLAVVAMSLVGSCVHAQESKEEFLNHARATYYSPQGHGLVSFSCQIKPDWATIPRPILPDAALEERSVLMQTKFQVTIKSRGNPDFSHEYPKDASTTSTTSAESVTRFLSSIVLGFFQTWMTKGFDTPFPPFPTMIKSITPDADGYSIFLDVPGGPVTLHSTKDYIATLIQSGGGNIDEHPVFSATSTGRLLTAVDAYDLTNQPPTHIQYEVGHMSVDGIDIPAQIHIKVNENVDVRFALYQCKVTKAAVIHVSPPLQ